MPRPPSRFAALLAGGALGCHPSAKGHTAFNLPGDASPSDAAAAPSGVAPHATARDAGPTDARPADARPTDARPTDARYADARPTDARSADAGSPRFLQRSAWTIHRGPIWAGQYGIAGDPSILVERGGGLTMSYTCFDPNRQGTETCTARSADGLSWTNDPPAGTVAGRGLVAVAGSWHEAHETPEIVDGPTGRHLFFVGYKTQGFFTAGGGVSMGRATVTGAGPFALTPVTPVWTPTPGGANAYGMTSPSIEVVGRELRMVYTGWTPAFATTLLAAISEDDGQNWTDHAGPLVSSNALPPFASNGIAETCLRTGPDGRHYLFFEAVNDPHRIGLAVADDWLGPYTFEPAPIVGPEDLDAWGATGPLAPHVIFEGDRVRLWFHVIETSKIELGYAEAAYR
jgi:hypothetical protein